jgi:hypothetical protein
MSLFSLFKPSIVSAPQEVVVGRVLSAFAYDCLECDSINEGARNGHGKSCGSQNIYHVRSLPRDTVTSPAPAQEQKPKERRGFVRALNGGVPLPLPKREPPKDAA